MDGVQAALKLLELSPNFTLEQLKSQYKKMVVKHHPDRTSNPLTAPMFQLLTSCYRLLVDEYQKKQVNMEHHELKAKYQHIQQQPSAVRTNVNLAPNFESKKFDVARFNQVFSDHKFKDPLVENGYQKWMEDPSSFKQHDVRKEIVKYKEPQPLLGGSSCGGAAFYQLGVDRIDDYSAENVHKQELNFMDYRVAYTAQTILEDESNVQKRKEYKSVEDLKNERSTMSTTMTERERIEHDKRLKVQESLEKKRLRKLAKYDQRVHDYYEKSHGLFIHFKS